MSGACFLSINTAGDTVHLIVGSPNRDHDSYLVNCAAIVYSLTKLISGP